MREGSVVRVDVTTTFDKGSVSFGLPVRSRIEMCGWVTRLSVCFLPLLVDVLLVQGASPPRAYLVAVLRSDQGYVSDVAFSPDGRMFAADGDDKLILWEVASWRTRTLLPSGDFAFSPDGKRVAVANRRMVRLCDLPTGKSKVWEVCPPGDDAISRATFSPDGKPLAFVYDIFKTNPVRLFDLTTGEFLPATLRGKGTLHCMVFSPDGKTLAAAFNTLDKKVDGKAIPASGEVRLFDVASWRPRAILRGHTDRVSAVALSPDGKTLASGCEDDTVRLWDSATGKLRATWTAGVFHVHAVAFSPNGRVLAVAGGKAKELGEILPGQVTFLDAATGKELLTLK